MFKSKKILLLSACLLSMQSLLSYDIDNLGKRIQTTATDRNVFDLLYTGLMETGCTVNLYVDPYLRYFKYKTDKKLAFLKQASEDKTLHSAHALAHSLVQLEAADKMQAQLLKPASEVVIPQVLKEVSEKVVHTPEIKTQTWGGFFSKWGTRTKYAAIVGTTIGTARTLGNLCLTTYLEYQYKHDIREAAFASFSKNEFIKHSQFLVHDLMMPANLEYNVKQSARTFMRVHRAHVYTSLDSIAQALQDMYEDLYKLRFVANIRIPASCMQLVTNPQAWDEFESALKVKSFLSNYVGVMGIVIAQDYFYGHENIQALIKNIVLRIAALELFNRCLVNEEYRELGVVAHYVQHAYPVPLPSAPPAPQGFVVNVQQTNNGAAQQ